MLNIRIYKITILYKIRAIIENIEKVDEPQKIY